MMKKLKRNGGLILTEALVAVATLATGGIILSTIINNALSVTQISKDYLVAQNLATEAMEIVKNVRNANVSAKPDDPSCWLVLNPTQTRNNPTQTCNIYQKLFPGYAHSPYLANGVWTMRYIPGSNTYPLDLATQPLYIMDAYYLVYVDPSSGSDVYVQGPSAAVSGLTPSKFYRSVHVTNVAADNSTASFEVRVQWFDGARERSVLRNYVMYNY